MRVELSLWSAAAIASTLVAAGMGIGVRLVPSARIGTPAACSGGRADAPRRIEEAQASQRLHDYLRTIAAQAPVVRPAADSNQPHDLVADGLAALGERQAPERNPFSDAVDKLQEDEGARSALLAQLAAESDPTHREHIRILLGFVTTPDVARAAIAMTGEPSARARREGFELLHHQDGNDARAAVAQALEREQDPQVLAAALQAVQAPSQRARVEDRRTQASLLQLTEHADPNVRANALQALARTGRSGSAPAAVVRGLSDEDEEVKDAALLAVVEGRLRSNDVKERVLAMLTDETCSPELRTRAVDVLDAFPLDARELALLTRSNTAP